MEGLVLLQISAPHFVAGLLIHDDLCVLTAPILRRFRGSPRIYIEQYCKQRGWKIEDVPLNLYLQWPSKPAHPVGG